MANAYRVYFKKIPLDNGGYTMDHTAIVYLMDREGHFVAPFSLKRKPEDGPRFCIGGIALDRGSRVASGLLEAALRETGARDLAERFGTRWAQRAVAVFVTPAAAAGAGVVAADVVVRHGTQAVVRRASATLGSLALREP